MQKSSLYFMLKLCHLKQKACFVIIKPLYRVNGQGVEMQGYICAHRQEALLRHWIPDFSFFCSVYRTCWPVQRKFPCELCVCVCVLQIYTHDTTCLNAVSKRTPRRLHKGLREETACTDAYWGPKEAQEHIIATGTLYKSYSLERQSGLLDSKTMIISCTLLLWALQLAWLHPWFTYIKMFKRSESLLQAAVGWGHRLADF